ncbi:hypothetical protein [Thermomonospora umbrina]|uniref:Mce-associated membrane protein n=1 Tax=Thermomonospora umbrina TaxID=111806 RepID=A0A3D9SHY9_9ACTN|nr:hypothetical protein [Thermomonospora umbrina]REE95538.1 Mce-associated membrane protein [Thermomonospora umbrina]
MTAEEEDRAPLRARLRGRLRGRATGRLLLALAVAFAAWGGWSLWRAEGNESIDFGAARDEVLAAGRANVAVLNTIDAAQADVGLQKWLDASTGPLRDELNRSREQDRLRIQQARTSTRGVVTDAAVTQLDVRAGTALLIAMVRVEVTAPSGGGATTDRKRFEAGLTRTPNGWKLRSLTAIPVDSSRP